MNYDNDIPVAPFVRAERQSDPYSKRGWCPICGWKKSGKDSWNGNACKCGYTTSSTAVSSQCQFSYDSNLCGRRSVACTRCGEDTQLCREHTEGLCAECREPDPREQPMSDAGKFLFELGMDLNRVYMAGMKAGSK